MRNRRAAVGLVRVSRECRERAGNGRMATCDALRKFFSCYFLTVAKLKSHLFLLSYFYRLCSCLRSCVRFSWFVRACVLSCGLRFWVMFDSSTQTQRNFHQQPKRRKPARPRAHLKGSSPCLAPHGHSSTSPLAFPYQLPSRRPSSRAARRVADRPTVFSGREAAVT